MVESCEICDKEAVYICGDCKQVKYCSSEHRHEHWKVHKEQCKVLKQEQTRSLEEKVNKKRLDIRRKYVYKHVGMHTAI